MFLYPRTDPEEIQLKLGDSFQNFNFKIIYLQYLRRNMKYWLSIEEFHTHFPPGGVQFNHLQNSQIIFDVPTLSEKHMFMSSIIDPSSFQFSSWSENKSRYTKLDRLPFQVSLGRQIYRELMGGRKSCDWEDCKTVMSLLY